MDFGDQCVMITGVAGMLEWYVDNLVMTDVSSLWLGLSHISFPNQTVYIAEHNYYSISTPPRFYHLDDVGCLGNETALIQCEHNGIGVGNCYEGQENAAVRCSCMFTNE